MIKNFLRRAVHHLKKIVFTGRKNPVPVVRDAVVGEEEAGSEHNLPAPRRRKRSRRKSVQAAASPPSQPAANTAIEGGWRPDDFTVLPEDGKGRFHDLSLPPPLMHAIYEQGFRYCTPIQDKALPAALAGKDLIGKANTGTGKSAVFLLAIFSRILEMRAAGKKLEPPLALVIAPTRELVAQIARDGINLGKYCDVNVVAVYGGAEYQEQ